MKVLKGVGIGAGILLCSIVLIVLVRTATLATKQESFPAVAKDPIEGTAAVAHLSAIVRFKTASFDDPKNNDVRELIALRNYLDSEYPLIRSRLRRTIINNYSLVYRWEGSDPGKKPIILAAHMDVVPVDPTEWKEDPFSGRISDGIIWGRGTLDDKGSLVSILEAVEYLLESGFVPERTIYLCFGHDEEAGTTGGMQGARNIAAYLKGEGVHAESILDEGGVIASETLSIVKGKDMALIGVAEKGFLTLRITAEGQSGHAMMPPKDLAVVNLSKAILALERNKMPSSLNGVIGLTFDYVAPEMPFAQRMLFANRWLFDPLLLPVLEKSNLTAAMMHTTVAPTMVQGGVKEQSLPAEASAVVNFRIVPGETSQDVIRYVERAIGDPRIRIEQFGTVSHEPIPLSGLDSEGYRLIDRTIHEVFPGVLTFPGLMIGRTDSLYYKEVADTLFRFAPYLYRTGDDKGPHGKNEFIRTEDYLNMIQFYIRYIRSGAGS